jgi:hypothetical protein
MRRLPEITSFTHNLFVCEAISEISASVRERRTVYPSLTRDRLESNQCPTKGCYDCPRYKENPGGNPYFQAKLSEGYHIRSSFLKDTGIADEFRNKADL